MVYKLNNGLTCIINNKKSSYSFNILLLVKTGSRNEKNGKRGLAHYLEHMMFKGTERRKNSKAISNNIYSKGGDTNAFTGFDVTGYYIESSSIYFKETCDVLSDMYFNSKFVGMKKKKMLLLVKIIKIILIQVVNFLMHSLNVFIKELNIIMDQVV